MSSREFTDIVFRKEENEDPRGPGFSHTLRSRRCPLTASTWPSHPGATMTFHASLSFRAWAVRTSTCIQGERCVSGPSATPQSDQGFFALLCRHTLKPESQPKTGQCERGWDQAASRTVPPPPRLLGPCRPTECVATNTPKLKSRALAKLHVCPREDANVTTPRYPNTQACDGSEGHGHRDRWLQDL